MRTSLSNINCIFRRKITFFKLLHKPRKSGFCLNIYSCGGAADSQIQRNKSIATRSKFLRLRRVGQLLERLIKIGLIS